MEVNNSAQRTIDDVKQILHFAKLKEEEIMPTSQALYFTNENLHNNNYKLLELDKYLLETLSEGQSLRIVGDDDENVVICSESRSYDVAETETSNSLLLVNNLKFSNDLKNGENRCVSRVTVAGTFYNYLEVTPGKPHLKKLNELLKCTAYRGPEYEHEIDKDKLLTKQDLMNTVQASKEEVETALKSTQVMVINNKVRLLDFEYHFRVLSYMLKLIDENSWALDEINYEETVNALSELVPFEVLNSLFELYTEKSKVIDFLQLYKYKEVEVCKLFAQVLLYSAGKFNLNEFLQAWKESVPEGMVTREDMLYGIALIDRNSTPNVIKAFPEDELPENITERFQVLFGAKEKWTVSEIAPYIQRLATDKCDVNALLAKHARASSIQGLKYYSAKHAK